MMAVFSGRLNPNLAIALSVYISPSWIESVKQAQLQVFREL